MGIVGLLLPLLPLAFVVAVGGWLSGLESSRRRRAAGVMGAVLASGLLLWVLIGGPPEAVLERTGVGCLVALPTVAAALVAFSSGLGQRPWVAILLWVVAYVAGFILAAYVWMRLGLPH
jgi:uncharacterized membrane protein YqaE (UPF0057 family)